MNIKWILLAISLAISFGPICAALVVHQSNLTALVMPENLGFLSETPKVSVEYQAATQTLNLRVSNPYDTALIFESMEAKIFCSTHNVEVGQISTQNPTTIKANSNAIIGLPITLTSDGQTHFITAHSGTSVNAELRDLELTVQGIKLTSSQPMSIGAITFP